MYLETLKLHNFRCFEDIEVNFNEKLTVIVGANGAGKTSIMEGAAIALSSMFVKMDGVTARGIDKSQAHLKAFSVGSSKDVQAQFPVEVSAKCSTYTRQCEWKRSLNKLNGNTTIIDAKEIMDLGISFQNDLRNGNSGLVLPLVAYYGTGRLWDYHREKQNNIFELDNRLNGYIDCVDGSANIKLMMNWFLKRTVDKYQNQELGFDSIPELDAVYSAMEECYCRITGCENVKVQYSMGTKELTLVYKDRTGNLMRMPFNQLSDGYKGTISLVADIAYRMAVLNPQLLGDVCKKTDGIVLIDEVDLHLHPQWQQRILVDLQAIFPKVQFIVSTHAPAVINTIAKEHVQILKDGKIYPAPVETYGKDTNGVMTTIMEVEERPEPVKKQFDNFYSALKEKKYELAEEVLDALEEEIGEYDPDLTTCRMQLDLAQL